MDITWYGHSCFRLSERGRTTIITDPFSDSIGLPSPKLKGDVVTISHDAPGHNFTEAVKVQPYVLSGPGRKVYRTNDAGASWTSNSAPVSGRHCPAS